MLPGQSGCIFESILAGKRHIPSATLAEPSMAQLTADFAPSAVLRQGQNDAATGTSRSPAGTKNRFLDRHDTEYKLGLEILNLATGKIDKKCRQHLEGIIKKR